MFVDGHPLFEYHANTINNLDFWGKPNQTLRKRKNISEVLFKIEIEIYEIFHGQNLPTMKYPCAPLKQDAWQGLSMKCFIDFDL